jgi:hypothetical protein
MVTDHMATWIDDLAWIWRPSLGWASVARVAADTLDRDPADCAAWCQLAMMFGDTRAPELALVVCLHACMLDAGNGRVRAHLDLCVLDLGLGRAATSPIPIAALGETGTVTGDPAALTAWITEHFAPFEGDVAQAARHALAIAMARFVE